MGYVPNVLWSMVPASRLDCPHLVKAAETVPGLRFRMLGDLSETETMSRISHLSWKADGIEWFVSPEDIAYGLRGPHGKNRGAEVVFAEVDGVPVGYSQVSWDSVNGDQAFYRHSVHVLPEKRGGGLVEAMFSSNEDRVEAIFSEHGRPGRRGVQLWASDAPNPWKDLVESAGYEPSWHLLELVHDGRDSVIDAPVPEGLDFSPVRPVEYPLIWSLCKECFSDDWWSTPERWGDDEYREWLSSERFMPRLWKLARAGDEVVGFVENHVSDEECRLLGRRVAHCNMVCVRKDWRRKGIATYLLTSSLKMLRDMDVDEVTLDTEVENVSRAVKVYEAVGFRVRRHYTFYRRTL